MILALAVIMPLATPLIGGGATESVPVRPDHFPPPTAPLRIEAPIKLELNMEELLKGFASSTGQNLVISEETRRRLFATATGLSRSVEVPPGEVYPFVEHLLLHHGFYVADLKSTEPRMLGIYDSYAKDRYQIGSRSVEVAEGDLELYTNHPALLIQTVVTLPNTDVRTLANSLRTMNTDANVQKMVPMGDSSSILLQGSGAHVASLASMLRKADDKANQKD